MAFRTENTRAAVHVPAQAVPDLVRPASSARTQAALHGSVGSSLPSSVLTQSTSMASTPHAPGAGGPRFEQPDHQVPQLVRLAWSYHQHAAGPRFLSPVARPAPGRSLPPARACRWRHPLSGRRRTRPSRFPPVRTGAGAACARLRAISLRRRSLGPSLFLIPWSSAPSSAPRGKVPSLAGSASRASLVSARGGLSLAAPAVFCSEPPHLAGLVYRFVKRLRGLLAVVWTTLVLLPSGGSMNTDHSARAAESHADGALLAHHGDRGTTTPSGRGCLRRSHPDG